MERRAEYDAYLNSPAWEAKRVTALQTARHRCAACGDNRDLHVHHLTYERLGDELQSDLRVLCQKCHSLVHQIHAKTAGTLAEATFDVIHLYQKSSKIAPVAPAPARYTGLTKKQKKALAAKARAAKAQAKAARQIQMPTGKVFVAKTWEKKRTPR